MLLAFVSSALAHPSPEPHLHASDPLSLVVIAFWLGAAVLWLRYAPQGATG